MQSPLKDGFNLDKILGMDQMVEPKKTCFWQKLFKPDKKNPKKKGMLHIHPMSIDPYFALSSLRRTTQHPSQERRR